MSAYGKFVPLMVKSVPPPVPPRNGVQPVTVEVNEVLYVNVAESLSPFSLTTTSHVVSAFCELGGILKSNFLFYTTPSLKINFKAPTHLTSYRCGV